MYLLTGTANIVYEVEDTSGDDDGVPEKATSQEPNAGVALDVTVPGTHTAPASLPIAGSDIAAARCSRDQLLKRSVDCEQLDTGLLKHY